MQSRITGLITALFLFVSVIASASAENEYDLTCSFDATKYHQMSFRFTGHLTINEDDTGTLEGYRGLFYADPELYTLVTYDSKRTVLYNDDNYVAKEEKWEDHLKFVLPNAGPRPSSGGSNQLFISLVPKSQKDKKVSNVPNPGVERISVFHAGLEYFLGDYGNRAVIKCTGYQYFPKKK